MIKESTFFLPYQQRWINDDSRLKIIEKSRQIGMSLATAYRLVKKHSCKNVTFDAWVSSRDEIQSKLFLEDCKKFADILHVAAKNYGKICLHSDKKISTMSLKFANERSIYSMSSNPNAQAGKRGSRILDEFALHPQQRELYAIAYPGITWGGNLEIISTHRGTQTFFYQLLKHITENGNKHNFSHHKVTLQDALEQGLLQKLKQKCTPDNPILYMDNGEYFDYIRRSCPDDEIFRQEYMCEPYDDQSIFIPCELIDTAENNYEFYLQSIENAHSNVEYFLGVDIGRTHDLTVFWVLCKVGDLLITKDVVVLKNQTFSEQEKVLYSLLSSFQVKRVCVDQTGIGRQFAERAEEFWGKYKIEGISFTNGIKEHLAYQLRTAFEDKKIKIPADENIRSDLRAVKRENTCTGKIRFFADSNENGHADRFWALALAVEASKLQSSQNSAFFVNIRRSKYEQHFKHF